MENLRNNLNKGNQIEINFDAVVGVSDSNKIEDEAYKKERIEVANKFNVMNSENIYKDDKNVWRYGDGGKKSPHDQTVEEWDNFHKEYKKNQNYTDI